MSEKSDLQISLVPEHFKDACQSCGSMIVTNVRHHASNDPLAGWYAECTDCRTTRFSPDNVEMHPDTKTEMRSVLNWLMIIMNTTPPRSLHIHVLRAIRDACERALKRIGAES